MAFFMRSRIGDLALVEPSESVPKAAQPLADQDEESLFWTLGPGRKSRAFRAIFDGSATTVLTGNNWSSLTLTNEQVAGCLHHFAGRCFPLSNSKTAEERDPNGLGAYFADQFGSSVFASHFAALWVRRGSLVAHYDGSWTFHVRDDALPK
jgi:hypothetical protein